MSKSTMARQESIKVERPYMVDIRFLQPVIDGYRLGVFNDSNLPMAILNALESLSQYGNVKVIEYYKEVAV